MTSLIRQERRAIVLLSGGLDSSTVLAVALYEGFEVHALTFDYGQRHAFELQAAQRIVAAHRVQAHTVVRIDLRTFGGSALTADISVPKHGHPLETGLSIPITYVPARNTIFLSYALALAEVSATDHIFVGVSAVDYSGYPDCRPEFIKAFEDMGNLAAARWTTADRRLQIHAPLQHLSKAETIRLGVSLGVDYALTSSCYDPDVLGHACGHCDSCTLRKKGFREAGIDDPTTYSEAVSI